jgi:hypothetical protein
MADALQNYIDGKWVGRAVASGRSRGRQSPNAGRGPDRRRGSAGLTTNAQGLRVSLSNIVSASRGSLSSAR